MYCVIAVAACRCQRATRGEVRGWKSERSRTRPRGCPDFDPDATAVQNVRSQVFDQSRLEQLLLAQVAHILLEQTHVQGSISIVLLEKVQIWSFCASKHRDAGCTFTEQ